MNPPVLESHLAVRKNYLPVLLICALAAFAGVWIYVALFPMAYLDDEYPAFVAKRQMLQACDLGTVSVLGDSRTDVAIVPNPMKVPVRNFSFNGGGPIEANTIARAMLKCPALPRLVVVAIGSTHLDQPDPSFWGRSAYFHLLERSELSDVLAAATRLNDFSEFTQARQDGLPDSVRIWLYSLRFPSLYFGGLIRGGFVLRYPSNLAALVNARNEHGHYFYGHLPISHDVAPEGRSVAFTPLPVQDHYFNSMLAALDKRGVDILLTMMPVNQETFASTSPQVRTQLATYLKSAARRYPHVHLVGEVEPHWPAMYFGDKYSHLNRQGATLYTARMDACLQKLLVHSGAGGVGCNLNP